MKSIKRNQQHRQTHMIGNIGTGICIIVSLIASMIITDCEVGHASH